MAEAVEIIEDDPIEVRRAKREALIAAGIDPLWALGQAQPFR